MNIASEAQIVDDLQVWLESFEGLSSTPCASLTYTRDTLDISIDDVTVWDDQSFYCDEREDNELSLEGCKSAWLAHLATYKPFLEAGHAQD
jgi:hypothetical protein